MKLRIDKILLLTLVLINGISLAVLYSAKPSLGFIIQQATRILIAFTIMLAVAQIHPRILQRWATAIYIVILLMLIAVLIAGYASNGAQRWINLGLFRFQPAEFMKLAVPLLLAKYFCNCTLPITADKLIVPLLLIAIPTLLIAIQPDLGTAIITVINGALVIFFAGIALRYIILVIIAVIGSIPALWYVLHDYQRQRILTFLNPEQDPLGSGYHIIQSKIAIGSGGLTGKGWLAGSQVQLDFIPERTTDFIFAVIGEEFGLLGVLILLTLFLIVVIRGLKISTQASNNFASMLAASLSISFFMYAFINIAMTMGLLPVVGVPLPLVSYGGTSMLTIMISFGIIMGIEKHRSVYKG